MYKFSIMIICVCLALALGLPCRAEMLNTRIGDLSFTSGYPDEETAKKTI